MDTKTIAMSWMNPKKIARRTALLESGGLTAREWANSVLYELVSAPVLDEDLPGVLSRLPPEVGRGFRCLLRNIEEADFHWRPFFLTSSTAPRDPTEYSAQLRRVSALLGRADDDRRSSAEVEDCHPIGGHDSTTPGDDADRSRTHWPDRLTPAP